MEREEARGDPELATLLKDMAAVQFQATLNISRLESMTEQPPPDLSKVEGLHKVVEAEVLRTWRVFKMFLKKSGQLEDVPKEAEAAGPRAVAGPPSSWSARGKGTKRPHN